MAEPTLALTFQDLIIRVAECLGVASYADGTAGVPTDAHDLEVCKRIVNDGWRRFYNSNPQWNWTNRTFSITFNPTADDNPSVQVDGEVWRYYMPDGFYGHMIGKMTYAENTGHLDIIEVPESHIRARRVSASYAGYPIEYSIRPITDDPQRRWELIVWPDPASALTVTGRCRIYPNKLVELTDRPSAGPIFDEAIEAACKAEAERQREDSSGLLESQWAEALTRAIAIDQKTAPSRLGDYGGGKETLGRVYTGVDTYTNQDGTVHSF